MSFSTVNTSSLLFTALIRLLLYLKDHQLLVGCYFFYNLYLIVFMNNQTAGAEVQVLGGIVMIIDPTSNSGTLQSEFHFPLLLSFIEFYLILFLTILVQQRWCAI
ncbi:hypothetical protein S245_060266 [Arachis hypogaea]